MDKNMLYNQIMEKIGIVVQQVLDETLTTFPLDKVNKYKDKIESNLGIIINPDPKQNNKINNKFLKSDKFDDLQLDIIKKDGGIFTENEKQIISDKVQILGFKFLISYIDPYNNTEHLFYTPNMQNVIDNNAYNGMEYLYHICPDYVVNKIKEIGFCPKSKNSVFSYDPRIHFVFNCVSIQRLRMLTFELDSKNKSKGNNHKYCLIKIKTPENIKFYKDLDYRYGVYTKENIPPEFIVQISDLEPMSFNEYLQNLASNTYSDDIY